MGLRLARDCMGHVVAGARPQAWFNCRLLDERGDGVLPATCTGFARKKSITFADGVESVRRLGNATLVDQMRPAFRWATPMFEVPFGRSREREQVSASSRWET